MSAYSKSIFISYAEEDLAFAEKLRSALTACGHAVWDYHGSVYADWRQWAKNKIATADYGLVVWSNASIESENVLSEAERIKKRGRYVPVRIDGAEVPLGFDTIQNFDLRGWTGNSDNKEWTRLLQRLDQTPSNPSESPRSSRAAVMIVPALGRFWSRVRAHLLTASLSGALGIAVVAGPWLIDNVNFGDAVTEALGDKEMNSLNESDAQIEEVAGKISQHYFENNQHMYFNFIVVLVDSVSHGNRTRANALQELPIARWKLFKREWWGLIRCKPARPSIVIDSKAAASKPEVNEAPDDAAKSDPICSEMMMQFRASSQENSIRRAQRSR
jgi:TIR domain